MKKTNVENFKEFTHEIEFMLFSDLVLLTIIKCGKLAMKRLEIYCISTVGCSKYSSFL